MWTPEPGEVAIASWRAQTQVLYTHWRNMPPKWACCLLHEAAAEGIQGSRKWRRGVDQSHPVSHACRTHWCVCFHITAVLHTVPLASASNTATNAVRALGSKSSAALAASMCSNLTKNCSTPPRKEDACTESPEQYLSHSSRTEGCFNRLCTQNGATRTRTSGKPEPHHCS
jgi:hypothetical protein